MPDYIILFCLSFMFMNNVGYWFFLVTANRFKMKKDFKIKNSELDHNIYPIVSFIIPIYNEEANIKRKIQSLIDINYPISRIEIVIVDDGSTDKCVDIIRELQIQYSIRLIQLQHVGPSNALKVGSHLANGDIIIWTDADAFLQNKDAINITVARLSDASIGAIFGIASENNMQSYDKCERHLFRNVQNLEGNLDSIIDTNGTFFAFRKKFINLIKTNCINYDSNLAMEIRKEGCKVIAEPLICMDHSFPKNMKSYLHRKIRMFVGCLETLYLYYPIIFNIKYGYFGMLIAPRNLLFRSIEPIIFIIMFVKIFSAININDMYYLFLVSSFIAALWIFKREILKEIINQISVYFVRSIGYFMFISYIYHKNIDNIWNERGKIK